MYLLIQLASKPGLYYSYTIEAPVSQHLVSVHYTAQPSFDDLVFNISLQSISIAGADLSSHDLIKWSCNLQNVRRKADRTMVLCCLVVASCKSGEGLRSPRIPTSSLCLGRLQWCLVPKCRQLTLLFLQLDRNSTNLWVAETSRQIMCMTYVHCCK